MPRSVKYEFENLFARPSAEEGDVVEEQPVFSEDELNAARQAAYADGFEAGRAEMLQDVTARASDAIEAIAASTSNLDESHEKRMATIHKEAVSLAHAIARTLAPTLVARQPLAEIENMVSECLAACYSEPRLVVRVAENLVDPVKEMMDRLEQEQSFAGKIIILGDDRLQGDHCRVEWADGGAERSMEALLLEVDRLVQRHLNGSGLEKPAAADETTDQPQHNGSENTDV